MATKKKQPQVSTAPDVADVIGELKRRASKAHRAGLARYAIPADHALGVPVGELRKLSKRLGKSHALALALWRTGHYEARMLATFVDEAELVTPEQMDRW